MLGVSAASRFMPSSFVGRDREVAQLVELVNAHRLVTVTGPGGVGKSRLVAEAGAALRAHFPGGIEFRSLTGLDASATIARISAQLGKDSPETVAVGVTA